MAKDIKDCTILNNGVSMPWLGLGVFQVEDGAQVESAVKTAVRAGYRSIDTAALYGNEVGVGKAVKECGVPREELFITTKVWNTDQGYDSTLAAFAESRSKLQLDYVDLYLIHWPVKGKFTETWKALEKLYKDGLVRAIGVSNFQVHHLKDVMADSEVIPAVNQVEYHPLLSQTELHSYCKSQNIQLEAWSPLIKGRLDYPILNELAAKYGKTPAQIVLRWDIQNEVVTIPKSVNEERIIANGNIFDFEISTEDMGRVNAMNKNERTGADPDNFNF